MNDEDLRACLVIMATAGLTFKHGAFDPTEPWKIADRIIEARDEVNESVGLPPIKSRKAKTK